MKGKLFLDIHVIQTVPPSCINRDDTGSPKTAYYGGVKRARVSSQSWKRSMRQYFNDEGKLPQGVRTKHVPELVANEIIAKEPSKTMEEAMKMAVDILVLAGIDVKEGKKKKDGEKENPGTEALMFISKKQLEELAGYATDKGFGQLSEKDRKAKLKEVMNNSNSPDIILFGRMLASNATLNVDASCQVAHAISTHKVDNEFDYYTGVDEANKEDQSGAGMIGTIEFNSATLYRYSTVAIKGLADQIPDKKDVLTVLESYIRAFILSMPTGKQNTFANQTIPDAVLIEVREDQPINLAGAFESPVRQDDEGGFTRSSIKALVAYREKVMSEFTGSPKGAWCIGEDMGCEKRKLDEAISEILEVLESEL